MFTFGIVDVRFIGSICYNDDDWINSIVLSSEKSGLTVMHMNALVGVTVG